jgi:glycosyltransferase involved in cell wall biosynthesis
LPSARRRHQALLPFYPAAFRSLGERLNGFDVVLADSSAWAHHVETQPDQVLVCYCHSPARFIYGDSDYLAPARMPKLVRQVMPVVAAGLRSRDRLAAQRVDRYIANSRNVARRIRRAYAREARVVYPPIDTERFRPPDSAPEPQEWFLVLSRLVPHKRVDIAVQACTRSGVPLKVIGDGRAAEVLQRMAGPTVEFLGALDDAAVADHLQRCRALILPGAEDFGMTAVEAQAAGRPVIAYGKGGALESVVAGQTGLFFSEPTAASLIDAIDRFERVTWRPEAALHNARRFGRDRFLREMEQEIAAAVAAKRR